MIHILHLWDAKLACPASLVEACGQLARLEPHAPGVNATFLALVITLSVNDVQSVTQPRWLRSRNEESRALTGAVWRMYTPEDEEATILPAIVEHATGLGLVVLSQALDLVFLPGGRVLPDDPTAPGATAAARIHRALRAERPGTLVRLRDDLQRVLAPQGFMLQPGRGDDAAWFQRATERGTQWVQLLVQTTHGVDHASVWLRQSDRAVDAVFAEVFPPADGPPRDIHLGTPSAFRGHRSAHVAVENAAQRQAVVDDLATHGLQVLNLACTLAGLDRLLHQRGLFPYHFEGLHPREPQSLADDLANHRNNMGRLDGLKPLVCAHLAGNPAFDQLADDLRRVLQGRSGVNEAHVDHLVAHLRARKA